MPVLCCFQVILGLSFHVQFFENNIRQFSIVCFGGRDAQQLLNRKVLLRLLQSFSIHSIFQSLLSYFLAGFFHFDQSVSNMVQFRASIEVENFETCPLNFIKKKTKQQLCFFSWYGKFLRWYSVFLFKRSCQSKNQMDFQCVC